MCLTPLVTSRHLDLIYRRSFSHSVSARHDDEHRLSLVTVGRIATSKLA